MVNRKNVGRILRKPGLALIAAMVFIVMIGAGKVYADNETNNGTKLTSEMFQAGSCKLTSGTYYLDEDLEVPHGLIIEASGAEVTLNLNGHTLKLNLGNNDYESVVYLTKASGSNAKVTINGGTNAAGEPGKLQGGKGNLDVHRTGPSDPKQLRGGGIAVSTGTVELNGVEISDNTAMYGGGIYLCERATVTINNCIITRNKIFQQLSYPYRDGAGVFIDNAVFNMNGGKVTLNTADGGWGGIFVGEVGSGQTPSEVNISGDAYIFTNTGNPDPSNQISKYQNLRLGTGGYGVFLLNIENVTSNTRVGVNMMNGGKFTADGVAVAAKFLTSFYSDMEDYVVIRNEDGGLSLVKRDSENLKYFDVVHVTMDEDGNKTEQALSIDQDTVTVPYDGKNHGIKVVLKDTVDVEAPITYCDSKESEFREAPIFYMFAGNNLTYFTITPVNKFAWISDSRKVVIEKRDIKEASLEVEKSALDYKRTNYENPAEALGLSVKDFGKDIPEDQYVISYQKDGKDVPVEDVKMPGSYKMIVAADKAENYTEDEAEGKHFNYTGSVEFDFTIERQTPAFSELVSLTLGGSIGVRFFLQAPDQDYYDYTDSYVTFEVANETGESAHEREIFFDRYAAKEVKLPDGKTYYEYICYVNSVQMADTITATFNYISLDEEGEQTATMEYSVKAYAEKVDTLKEDEYPADARALVQGLADYGHYVQPYLSALRGWAIGTAHENMDKYYTDSYSEDEIKAAKTALAGRAVVPSLSSKITQVKYSLYLDTDTAIYLYFKPDVNYTGGAEATINGVKTKVYLTADKRFKVVIPNIGAHLLGKEFTVNLKTGSLDNTVTVSAMSYVKAILQNPDKTDTDHKDVNAMMALYNYYDKAMKYIGG